MSRTRRLRVAIIGAGKVGSVLGRILVENGEHVVAVISRTAASAGRGGRFIGCRIRSTQLSSLPRDAHLVLIATPHAAVEEVARSLAALTHVDFRRTAFCHVSGMLTADALRPLADRGSVVFSFHPLQTFPRDFSPRKILPTVRGISYGVDGPPRGLRMARLLARTLEGTVVVVPPERRVFYHAACVVASNHLTALLSILQAMYREIEPGGKSFVSVFKPIIETTLRNVERTSPAEALSGPVVRGGAETIAEHFEALRHVLPAMVPYYARMTMETLRLALAKDSLTPDQIHKLIRLIVPYLNESPNVQEPL